MTAAKIITTEIVNIVDIIGNIVSNVQAEYDLVNSEKPYYIHGHPLEIINTLIEKTQNDDLKFKKYPLIALFEDFDTKNNRGVFSSEAKLNIVLITDTSKDYKAAERYTNSFDAILTPIFNLFVKYAKRSTSIYSNKNAIQMEPVCHLFWGKKGLYGVEGNIFNDYIDAIEIKNFDAKIYR